MASIESTRRGLKNPEKRALLIIHFRRDKKRHGDSARFSQVDVGTLKKVETNSSFLMVTLSIPTYLTRHNYSNAN